jgi:D-3-phosphoglycerate dehydrogenase / 2-oxoglutarate reductase
MQPHMSSNKVLITADVHPYLQNRFHELGFETDVIPDIPRSQLLNIIPGYDVLIITTYLKADKELLDRAANLKIIGRVGSGMENVDVEYAKQKNIRCFHSPEGNAHAVGEHTLGLLLGLLHKIHSSALELKNKTWNRESNRGMELSGKTVGIIGFGHTGAAFAQKLAGFDVRILAFDPYKKSEAGQIEQVDLDVLRQECEVISFHVPYNPETHHFISKDFISGCRKKPVLLNTSRGAVADTLAVIEALDENRIAGYGADVFEDEPVTKNETHPIEVYQQLFSFENVLATPHIAGWTIESKYLLAKVLMNKMEPFLTF